MFWAAEQRSKAMKITVKLKTGTSQEEAEMLIKASGNAFPGADIDVIYCDDPAMSVVMVEKSASCDVKQASHEIDSSVNPYERLGWEYGRD